MFDSGSGGSDIGTFDSGNDRSPERRQYTLKGVEADTIKLMRYAANKEGMKIGSWVSLRMKEAAERALSDHGVTSTELSNSNSPVLDHDIMARFIQATIDQKELVELRFSRIERELHEMTVAQRTILSALLASKSTK